ncbi:nuclear transport factor 2 family protein [Acrocarpospora sp. B8E8]|uniref:nuclear transport factor 2 family protein n=1 Tax=Acrocarpospora sp. B8E8 TaxID=3153572 RepID=UPI00325E0AA6
MSDGSARKLDLRDHLEIQTLIAQVCKALDFSRTTDFVAAFTTNGTYQVVSSDADGRKEQYSHHGAEALLEFAQWAASRRRGLARHWTGNPIIESDGRGGATAWSYTLLIEIDPETKRRNIVLSGVHEDVFVRTEAGWRLASRTVVADI